MPSATVPARVRAPLRTSKVSRRVVLPPELGPTSTTLRDLIGLEGLEILSAGCTSSFVHHGDTLLLFRGPPQPLAWRNSQSMALRRRRTYASSVTEEQTVEGGLAEPEELEPDQGSLDLAAPEDRHDRAELGGSGRRRAPQGPPARRRRPRRAGLGQAHPDDPRRHRHHPARYAGAARRPRHGAAARADRGVGHPGAPRRHGRQDGQRDAAHRPRGRGHLAVARGRRGHRLDASCSTRCCSTSRRWSCRRPRPVPAPSCGTPTAAS